jgi:hypothetical protein
VRLVAEQATLMRPSRAARRRRSCPELFGVAEVAEALNVTPSNLQYVKDLPEPVQRLRCSKIWLADEIREFAAVYRARRAARLARVS